MKLSELKSGETAIIVKVSGHGGFRKRIMEMGFVRGQKVTPIMKSPLNDPINYSVMGYDVSLRRSEAAMVEVLPELEAEQQLDHEAVVDCYTNCDQCDGFNCIYKSKRVKRKNEINVALVGNPNSGKTSLFNALSGSSEHVGNYSGVTVDAKCGHFNYKEYRFNITDLPGTYSLSAYSPEEIYVRHHLLKEMPDVIINVVVASNLERNLYLTTELIDINQRTIVALNMYDELLENESKLDYNHLGAMMGIPMVPTVAKNKQGLTLLLDTIIDLFENRNKIARHIHIQYGSVMEKEITALTEILHNADDLPQQFPARYWAIKLIENDIEACKILKNCKQYNHWKQLAEKSSQTIDKQLNKDVETAISDAKYGFIAGALQETYNHGTKDTNNKTRKIDRLVANKWLGFPIFILLMWIMFTTTFQLGAYPQDWIEKGFSMLGNWIVRICPEGAFQDLLVNGIIGGVGSVAVFLPNILILYLFISLMEDSGYMARAAFIMDKLMHHMGIHGKSFIPLLMGFGCNVPAIMATRTIESRSSRIITILITPFMSCSARLPVFILLTGTFFPKYAAFVLIGLYLFGALIAVITARLLRHTHFKADETPFVMELPPYRWPTLHATIRHMWDKCEQYLKKIGTVILLATIIIWVLSYYPHNEATTSNINETELQNMSQYENSYIGKIGKFIEPVMKPMGLNWRASVALITSIPAKELVVSTLGVLYGDKNGGSLSDSLLSSGDFNHRSALAFMIFILLFFPCIATVAAVASETGKRSWALFTVIYNTVIAWLAAYGIYLITGLI